MSHAARKEVVRNACKTLVGKPIEKKLFEGTGKMKLNLKSVKDLAGTPVSSSPVWIVVCRQRTKNKEYKRNALL